MTKYYLRLFIVGMLALSLAQPDSQAQVFRVIMVVDTLDPNIGESCKRDVAIMTDNCRQISHGIDYTLRITLLANRTFQASAVQAVLDTMQVQPSDILFFYYSGHGYNLDVNPTDYPFLRVTDYVRSPLSLDGIEKKLRIKGARLCITMADCCNNLIPFASLNSRSIGKSVIVKGGNNSEESREIIRQLFLAPQGSIKISSSKRTQFSVALPDGSAFTQAFERAFDEALLYERNIDWTQLLKNTQARLDLLMNKPQQAIFSIDPNENSTPGPAVKPEVVPTPPVVLQPDKPQSDEIFTYLNRIADETLPETERRNARTQVANYFIPKAHVALYQNDTEVESQTIERLLGRLYLNAANIREVNIITKNMTYDPTLKRYTAIAVQEIWTK